MKTKGKLSVASAIMEALRDIDKQCKINDVQSTFTKHSLFERVKAYCGVGATDDEQIGRMLRRLRQTGKYMGKPTFWYSASKNGIYKFNLE